MTFYLRNKAYKTRFILHKPTHDTNFNKRHFTICGCIQNFIRRLLSLVLFHPTALKIYTIIWEEVASMSILYTNQLLFSFYHQFCFFSWFYHLNFILYVRVLKYLNFVALSRVSSFLSAMISFVFGHSAILSHRAQNITLLM